MNSSFSDHQPPTIPYAQNNITEVSEEIWPKTQTNTKAQPSSLQLLSSFHRKSPPPLINQNCAWGTTLARPSADPGEPQQAAGEEWSPVSSCSGQNHQNPGDAPASSTPKGRAVVYPPSASWVPTRVQNKHQSGCVTCEPACGAHGLLPFSHM